MLVLLLLHCANSTVCAVHKPAGEQGQLQSYRTNVNSWTATAMLPLSHRPAWPLAPQHPRLPACRPP